MQLHPSLEASQRKKIITTSILLLLANILTILFYLNRDIEFYTLIWIYFFQFTFIGFFKILFLFTSKQLKFISRTKRFTKFAIGYFLAAFYAMFLFFFATSFSTRPPNLTQTDLIYMIVLIGLFFITHLSSYLYQRQQISKKMKLGTVLNLEIFGRIFPMWFLLIIAAGIEEYILAGNELLLYGFFIAKVITDEISHILEKIRYNSNDI